MVPMIPAMIDFAEFYIFMAVDSRAHLRRPKPPPGLAPLYRTVLLRWPKVVRNAYSYEYGTVLLYEYRTLFVIRGQ